MPRPPQSDLQELWESRIRNAVAVKEEWEKQFRVEMGRDYFEGKQNPGWNENEWITVNKIYSHMKAQLPQLYNVDPYFYVKVKRSYSPNPLDIVLFEQRGKIRQAYLNYLKGELELKSTARLAVQDAHFAFGVLKTHYSADEVDNEDAGNPIKGEDDSILVGEDGGPLLEPDTLFVNERYNWTRVHPDDLIFDEDAGTLPDKWGWIAERIKLTPEEAKKDPRLTKSVIDTAPTKGKKADDQREKGSGFFRGLFAKKPEGQIGGGDAQEEVLIKWEIYDLKANKWLAILEGAERPAMMPSDLPSGIEKDPYSILRFTLRDKSPYPIPPISQALDPQKEYNLSRSRILQHRKRFNRKYEVVQQGLVDDAEAAKLESGEDGTFIMVTQTGSVVPIKDAPLDQQTYQEILLLNNDMVEVFGSSDEARGLATADSATQASLIDKRLEIREGDALSLVIDWVRNAAKKMDQTVQAHITRDEAVRITGPAGDEMWELVRASDFERIAGEFEYSVNVGSTIPRLPQIERAQWMAFLQVIGSTPAFGLSPRLIKKMAELHHIEDDAMVEEIVAIFKKLSEGLLPGLASGGAGSQAGIPEDNPITQVLGRALGQQGGITNSGGAPGAAE